ncbi:hypothetical protein [Pedobacter sp. L105]|uniref:hypothetical protein n=1 Tax=Pedobacter sp. L105 TaxID=1641871 RepID=UPI00131E1CAB|nr:hypothetical protein [Pedobacter sp. L105]
MKKLFEVPTDLVEYENWMMTATWQELAESFNQVCTAAVASCSRILKKVTTVKTRSCLRPMKYKTIYPVPYDIGSAKACRTSQDFRFGYYRWRDYLTQIRLGKIYIRIQEEIEMEKLLLQAQKILMKQ